MTTIFVWVLVVSFAATPGVKLVSYPFVSEGACVKGARMLRDRDAEQGVKHYLYHCERKVNINGR